MTAPNTVPAPRGAGLLRRLAALVYDAFLLLAILFTATAGVVALRHGEALPPGQWLYSAFLLVVTFLFFAWFWTHGGQTLGMKAWHLKVLTQSGGGLSWRRAALRFFAAGLSFGALGLGYVWVLIDPEGFAWHDRLSGTRVVRVERRDREAPGEGSVSGASEQTE